MSPTELREYTAADHPAVTELWRRVFGGLKPEDEAPALAGTVARNPGLFLLAVDTAGAVVGTAIGTTDGRRGFLYHVAVHPSLRRSGVGRALLDEVERRLFATGVHTVHLRVEGDNAAAIAFYATLGYSADPPVIGMRITRSARAARAPVTRVERPVHGGGC